MTLLTTYDPRGEAYCPHCKTAVKCVNTGGIMYGSEPYLDFHHKECGTAWRYYTTTRQIVSPIPQPMSLRAMMGEKNWYAQIDKERVERAAPAMLEALEAILAGDFGGVELAREAVAKAKGK